jgi:hypothetical protein
LGIDYSENAIKLASMIREFLKTEEGEPDIFNSPSLELSFGSIDILHVNSKIIGTFDCIIDKGTFDSISLMKEAEEYKIIYLNNILSLMKSNSMFLITSCNWTKEEIVSFFSPSLAYYQHIPYREFSFQNQKGSVVCTIALTLYKPNA